MSYEKLNKESKATIELMVADGIISRECAEKYFPELKESEDERIRKELIDYCYERLNTTYGALPNIEAVKRWLAWLEKQGEQKTAWSEEDAKTLDSILNDLRQGAIPDDEDVNWLKNLKDRVQLKQEWSEVDKMQLDAAIHIVANSGHTCTSDWLKALKERVELQNSYNPYKEVVESIAEMCKNYDNMDVGSLQDFYDNVKVKCKDAKEYDSLFPQSTWKPSDEQMETLEYYMCTLVCTKYKKILFGLYSDLKKLREE